LLSPALHRIRNSASQSSPRLGQGSSAGISLQSTMALSSLSKRRLISMPTSMGHGHLNLSKGSSMSCKLMSRSYEFALDDIAEYLRFLFKAQLFWFTLNSSYDHGGELCNLMAATRGNNEAAARQGQRGMIADATINSR
jgi:hypothetical protein